MAAQETASGRMTRGAKSEVRSTKTVGRQVRRDQPMDSSLVEVGRVNRMFGRVLHQRMDPYTGSVDEFGCPGNTVDDWRLQFNKR